MSASLEDVIGKDAVARLSARGALIHGLPGKAYTSQALLEREFERLFAPSWIYVGHLHEIPNPGDAQPVNLLGLPILVVRNAEGRIRALHNVCRHRGTRVISELCRGLKSLVCPYHGWTYDLDGALRASPNFAGHRQMTYPGFDAQQFGLKPMRCDVWGDWVFVNPSGDAPPLLEYLEPLLAEVEGFAFDKLTHMFTIDFGEIPANWKIILENSLENYHLSVVHPQTAALQPLEDHFSIINRHCIGSGIDIKRASDDAARVDAGPDSLNMSARYLALLPNFFVVTYQPDVVMTRLLLPVDATRSVFQVRGYSTSAEPPSRQAVEAWRRLTETVEGEDVDIHVAQQAGRSSPVTADGGVLSPAWEESIRAFHEFLLERL